MAAPRGGEAVWNRLHVPRPACSATVAVPAQHPSVRCMSAVMMGCHAVSSMLTSTTVIIEQRLLHSIIYSFHYQMSHHRPYRSLKQVEQCLKRLNVMNLKKSIEDLILAGPSQLQKSENAKESLVPSQPVIEVLLVKILGACKLLLRLFDCCCTAFLLTVKHLCLEEYILFNTVVSGLLSRLWVLYRGLLKSLSALYGSLFALLQEVSKIELKPYIKGFVFPAAINEFLGTSYPGIGKKIPKAFVKKKDRIGWMNKLFQASKPATCIKASSPSPVRTKMMDADDSVDIGKPVVVRRTNQGHRKEFDVKSLCSYPNPIPEEDTKFRVKLPASKSLKSEHLAAFVSKFREAHSFEELCDTLRSTISWCKSHKLGSKAFFLGMKLLKSRRLQHVEAQGYSLQRKLGCVKATICKYLMVPSCRKKPTKMLRARSCLQRQISHSGKPRYNVWKTLTDTQPYRKRTHANKNMNDSFALSLVQYFEHLPQVGNTESSRAIEEQAPGNASGLLALERTSAGIQQDMTESKDDIDDIFGAIGL